MLFCFSYSIDSADLILFETLLACALFVASTFALCLVECVTVVVWVAVDFVTLLCIDVAIFVTHDIISTVDHMLYIMGMVIPSIFVVVIKDSHI